MFDLKVINSVLDQLEQERGIPRAKTLDAIEQALATAYKKEYGKRGQIIKASFDPTTGATEFSQIKIVVDDSMILGEDEEKQEEEDERVRFNDEHHIMIETARLMKKDAQLGEEIVFPLEIKGDYGRISAQTAKQVIIQKIREAEKVSVFGEFEDRQGEIISGTVQRVERGNVFIDLGRATGIMPYEEQIPGERFRQGERIHALLYNVEESARGIFLRLSRSKPEFLLKLFEREAPEVANGTVEVKSIAREAGARSKIAVYSHDEYIDPVGSLVGQRGVRVSTVMSELGGEKIDIIEWSEDTRDFVEEALSPARVLSVEINEAEKTAYVEVAPDQQSLAIGKGGQNARLAAKLTGWKIDITSADVPGGDEPSEGDDSDFESFDSIKESLEDDEAKEETTDEESSDTDSSDESAEESTETEEEVSEESTEEDTDSEEEKKD